MIARQRWLPLLPLMRCPVTFEGCGSREAAFAHITLESLVLYVFVSLKIRVETPFVPMYTITNWAGEVWRSLIVE